MSDELDLSAYENDVVEHVLMGRARARMLEDLRDEKPWNVDLTLGKLVLGEDAFRAQILGTFSNSSATFLWAWANSGNAEWGASLEIANSLRQRGERPGNAVFQETSIAAGWVNPNELAYVSGELAGGHPVFVGAYDGGAALLLLTSARLDVADLPLAYLPGILSGFGSFANADPRPCVRRFVERLGFSVDPGDRSLTATRGADTVTVSFDSEGRVAKVSLQAQGHAP